MSSEIRYEVLDGLPAYGDMYIPIPDGRAPFYSQGFVVRFFRKDGSSWVGNFRGGIHGMSKVIQLLEDKLAVFAKGTCYIMNPDQPTPLAIFGAGFQECLLTGKGQIIAFDFTDLTLIQPNGEYWRSPRISWDGFKDLKIHDCVLSGMAYNPMGDTWDPFTFNIDSRSVTGGSYQALT